MCSELNALPSAESWPPQKKCWKWKKNLRERHTCRVLQVLLVPKRDHLARRRKAHQRQASLRQMCTQVSCILKVYHSAYAFTGKKCSWRFVNNSFHFVLFYIKNFSNLNFLFLFKSIKIFEVSHFVFITNNYHAFSVYRPCFEILFLFFLTDIIYLYFQLNYHSRCTSFFIIFINSCQLINCSLFD